MLYYVAIMSKRGKFVVLYGINNIGKSTQAKLLVSALQSAGKEAVYIKYPLYNMDPSRSIINEALRAGNPDKLSGRELQIIFALNRTQFAPILESYLSGGINVVAEDYVGTRLAWGIVTGVDGLFLERLNSHLVREDEAFLLDGMPFANAEEKHVFEGNKELTVKARDVHRKLATDNNWHIVDASQAIEAVHSKILEKLDKIILIR